MSDIPADLDLSILGQSDGSSDAAAPAGMNLPAPPPPTTPAPSAVSPAPTVVSAAQSPTVSTTVATANPRPAAPASPASPVAIPVMPSAPSLSTPQAPPATNQTPATSPVPYPTDHVPTTNRFPWNPLPPTAASAAPAPSVTPAELVSPPSSISQTGENDDGEVALSNFTGISTGTQATTSPEISQSGPVAVSPGITMPAASASLSAGPTPTPAPHSSENKILHIYSDYTREVWKAFRPSRAFGLFIVGSFGMILAVGLFLWMTNGMSIYEVPIIKSVLKLE